MSHDLVLEGKAFVNQQFQQCCIGIDDGKITAIKKVLTAEKTHRFSKELLLPAGIDAHVHFRDPGMTHKETFQTGSIAAAHGGISCVFDMPNTRPASFTPETILDKQQIASRKSIVDFGVYAGVSKKILSTIGFADRLASVCHGFKMFLGATTNSLTLSADLIQPVLNKIKLFDKPVFVHAEDNSCLQHHKGTEHRLVDHHTARPPSCERQAINQVVAAAKTVETPVHICHASSAAALRRVQNTPSFITYGITPHHSLLNMEYKKVQSTWLKVNPPLRPKQDQQILLNTIQNGDVFLLESDHAPHTLQEKDKDFAEAPCGIPGVETMYPLFLALAVKQRVSLPRIISLLSEHPSQLLNLSKGFIAPGYDADIIAVNRKNIQKIRSDQLHSKANWSPFEGFPAVFPSTVFIRGTKVIDEYEQQVSAGFGSMIPVKK
ncbi:MAG: dihydroorotase [Candidatus Thermoplasmatota archaeon]|nr:dihydroorotase [Candidatus Thermoplasmatota archaeon]